MRTSTEAAPRGTPPSELLPAGQESAALLNEIVLWLEDAKAEKIVTIDLKGKSSIGDFMVIASGRSDRHVGAIAEQIRRKLKEAGQTNVRVEGLETCDWVLIDTGDLIIHVFRPEVREFYNLEKMWSAERPAAEQTTH
jgi:ribosome-associated protein